jgi:hypothetical protein
LISRQLKASEEFGETVVASENRPVTESETFRDSSHFEPSATVINSGPPATSDLFTKSSHQSAKKKSEIAETDNNGFSSREFSISGDPIIQENPGAVAHTNALHPLSDRQIRTE